MASFESESNDIPATADTLGFASPVVGQLATAGDVDLYAIQAAVDGGINVSIATPTNSADFDYFSLAVLDASGGVLSLYDTGRDATYTTGIANAGLYYVRIESSDLHNNGDYELVVTQSARAPGRHETESNDTPETADPLALSSPVSGQLATAVDADLFAVEATAAGEIEISIDAPTNSATFDYFSLTLLDASGTVLWRNSTGKDDSFRTGVPEPGVYYVSIEVADYHNAEAYELLVTQPAVDGTAVVTGTSADDLLTVEPGDTVVEAGDGDDSVQLPFLLTAYNFEEQTPGDITAAYDDWSVALNDVEFLEFGTGFRTTIPVEAVISGEAQRQIETLSDLYLAYFGRAPDIEGLEFWQELVVERGVSLAEVSEAFARSDEAQGIYPPDVSNRDFVREVYLNALGREPDEDGWDYWTAVLDASEFSDPAARGAFVGSVVLGAYAETSGARDREFLSNRHEVSLGYINRLLEQPGEGRDAAIDDLLLLVTDDEATAAAAEELLDYVFEDPITLTGVMTDQALVDSFFG
jgi:hypothetical protein